MSAATDVANKALLIYQNYPQHVRDRQQAKYIKQLADSVIELDSRYERALDLLAKCYDAGHRNGWEDGPTTEEVMSEVADLIKAEDLERTVFSKVDGD